jgi:hypothetical protein
VCNLAQQGLTSRIYSGRSSHILGGSHRVHRLNAFTKVRKLSGVATDIHLHSLRHFQAAALDAVISEKQKQSRLGWSSTVMARHYTDAVSYSRTLDHGFAQPWTTCYSISGPGSLSPFPSFRWLPCLRMDSPLSSTGIALWTMRSMMASATVRSPRLSYHCETGNCEEMMSEPFSPRSSKRSRISLEPSGEIEEIPQSSRMSRWVLARMAAHDCPRREHARHVGDVERLAPEHGKILEVDPDGVLRYRWD